MSKKGYLEGAEMATTFNMLRANDLIWSFVVNNYLLGKDPFPFDLLYWNADATRMPAAMHSFYLRNMYQENLLVQPGGIDARRRADRPRARSRSRSTCRPARRTTSRPATSVYKATQIYSGPGALHAGGSGHIAGVVNPPRSKKYQHWVNETAKNPPTLDEWQAGAEEPRLVVARLGQVAVGQVRRQGAGARARRRRPARHRGRARQLREGAHDRLRAIEQCVGLGLHLSAAHVISPFSAISATGLAEFAQSFPEDFPPR